MAESGCIFSQYCLPMLFGGSSLLALILLRLFGGKRLACSEYLFGVWNFFAFICHATVDTYFFFHTRVTPKTENEPIPKPDDYLGCYHASIRKAWREYGAADTRVFMDEFQPLLLTMTYGAAIGAGTLTFLTFIGHLFGRKWAHPMQIAAATLHIALMYNYCFPEYLVNFKHVKNMQMFAAVNLPFVVMPALALLSSLCKMSCGSCASVCPVSSTTAAHDQQKKKKQ